MLERPDFKPTDFPNADIDFRFNEINELGEFHRDVNVVVSPGLKAAIKTYGKNICVSREVIINDDIELVSGLFSNAGAAAGRIEGGKVYALIESNPTMGDGAVMFHSSFSNIEAAILDATSLGSAMARLRTNRPPVGEVANLNAAFLVVSPSLELSARTLVHVAGLDEEITVIGSAWLPAGRWYLMASPDQSPVVGLLHLANSKNGIFVGPRRRRDARDAVPLGLRFDFGVVALGRVGIVKGGL